MATYLLHYHAHQGFIVKLHPAYRSRQLYLIPLVAIVLFLIGGITFFTSSLLASESITVYLLAVLVATLPISIPLTYRKLAKASGTVTPVAYAAYPFPATKAEELLAQVGEALSEGRLPPATPAVMEALKTLHRAALAEEESGASAEAQETINEWLTLTPAAV